MNTAGTNEHGINAAKGMVYLYIHHLMHMNVLILWELAKPQAIWT